MSNYLQPDFYRFNQDSLFLVKWIAHKLQTASHVLDLGAGSGVIGIEVSNRLNPQSLTLVELQKEFLPYLETNSRDQKKAHYDIEIVNASFGDFKTDIKFDLIVSNPPYYLPGRGEASRDVKKGRARSFIVDGWAVLLQRIEELLTSDGRAFIVIKNDKSILSHLRKEVRGLKLSEFVEKDLVVLELARLHEDRHHELS